MLHPVLEAWLRIESWLDQGQGLSRDMLPAGASHRRVARLERHVGRSLPQTVKMSYLRHDGSGPLHLFKAGRMLSVDEIETTWHSLRSLAAQNQAIGPAEDSGIEALLPEPRGPIHPAWWHAGWIPLIQGQIAGHTLYTALDTEPPPHGKRGQLITISDQRGPMQVLADHFSAYLQHAADRLVAGRHEVASLRPVTNHAGTAR